jgi:hypothetical protein
VGHAVLGVDQAQHLLGAHLIECAGGFERSFCGTSSSHLCLFRRSVSQLKAWEERSFPAGAARAP